MEDFGCAPSTFSQALPRLRLPTKVPPLRLEGLVLMRPLLSVLEPDSLTDALSFDPPGRFRAESQFVKTKRTTWKRVLQRVGAPHIMGAVRVSCVCVALSPRPTLFLSTPLRL